MKVREVTLARTSPSSSRWAGISEWMSKPGNPIGLEGSKALGYCIESPKKVDLILLHPSQEGCWDEVGSLLCGFDGGFVPSGPSGLVT